MTAPSAAAKPGSDRGFHLPDSVPEEVIAEVDASHPHHAPASNAFERIVGQVMGVVCAILLVAEILILAWGVTCRYFLSIPESWTAEVAIILFLWLSMLGAVLALQRTEHMRLTAAVDMLPSAWRDPVITFAHVVSVIYLGVISYYAVEFTIEQHAVLSQALEIPDSYRVVALPIAFIFMLLMELGRLRRYKASQLVASFVIGIALAALFWFFRDTWQAMGVASLGVFFGIFCFAIIFAGAPIAFSFGVATLAYLAFSTDVPLPTALNRMDVGMSSMLLLAVPLFIFLGLLIEVAGMAKTMVGFLATLLGHVRGGLQYVLLGAMFLVSGISGSKVADMAAIAPVLFPEMKKRGENEGRMVSLLAASGAMSETIPPSIVLIAIGAVGGVSIAALFAGGLLPAVVLAIVLMVFTWYRARNIGEKIPMASGRVIGKAFLVAIPALILPLVIRVFVLEGVATATEVSTVGVIYTMIVALLTYKQVEWKRLGPILVESAALSGAVLLIVGSATAMAWALTQSGFSRGLVELMTSAGGKWAFIGISMVVFVILGSVLEGLPVIVLFGPLVFPVARALGMSDVHYAMIIIIAMGIGLFAPPFGLGFYAACAIGRVNPAEAMRHIWPYLAVLIIGLVIVAIFPQIATALI
jgi:tripartite ATP-independent transporter DctM subunit